MNTSSGWKSHLSHWMTLWAPGLLLLMITGSTFASDGWKAGVASANITPTEPIWMAGYASRDRPAEGKLTDLWAKALVLEDTTGKQVVIITLDLIGIDRDFSTRLCKKLSDQFGFPRDSIAICCSHTHTGPVVGYNLRPMHFEAIAATDRQKILKYAESTSQKIIDVVDRAQREIQPASLTWSVGTADFAVNRRNNPENKVPQLRQAGQLVGPIDHAVPVLAVRKNDKLKAVLFGYACHATVLSSFEWSGDYPGFAQIEIEEAIPDCTAMFWAGCGADQNPLPRRSVELAKNYGQQLGQAVLAELKEPMQPITGKLHSQYSEIDLPFDDLPDEADLQKDVDGKDIYRSMRAKVLLRQIQSGKPLSKTYPYPIQTWRIGDEIPMVFLGGEVVVDFAIKTKSLNDKAWVAGYANDVMAYIPSRRVWLEGGYEGESAMVYYGLPTRWDASVEQLIMAEIRKQLAP